MIRRCELNGWMLRCDGRACEGGVSVIVRFTWRVCSLARSLGRWGVKRARSGIEWLVGISCLCLWRGERSSFSSLRLFVLSIAIAFARPLLTAYSVSSSVSSVIEGAGGRRGRLTARMEAPAGRSRWCRKRDGFRGLGDADARLSQGRLGGAFCVVTAGARGRLG